ncbi:Aspartic proteinase nepenthesin-1 precursor, putative [Theobroma cacao]|uniref:Aspartic proteinase nepenthesin-1, putative n=1 Tax=Theobroma cacao TaxID=3641 RepID=A0A061FDC5_THECC|nr:Aspartic proteinase nepenthesin-1 precursor, putative [Theobroma cacao]
MSATLHFLNAKLFLCLLVTLFHHHFVFATSNPAGLSLRAVIDDSPQSPLYLVGSLSRAERIAKLIKITKARANYLDLVSRPNARVVPDYLHIPILRDVLFYVVVFTLGSQQHPVKLLMDTGGGLIWTQCQPCKNCFPQNLQIYDPRVSASYGTLPCDHPLCDGDHRLYDCVNGECVYDVRYAGGASTRGVASLESFQFFIDHSSRRTFSNVIFGCSDDNTGFSFKNCGISGIFGLNLSPDSMSSQFSPLIHNRFSYCFVPFLDAMPRPIILRFGEDIPQLPPEHLHTTLFTYTPPGSYYFYLELLDISVANHRLGFQPDTFRIRQDGLGGCFIDSGALVSQIDSNTFGVNAYEAVLAVFGAYYGSRGLQRTNGRVGLELCYETPANYHDFAAITFHFNGADYTVDGQLGHFIDPVNGFFCVAITSGQMGTVLGAWHQQNKRIIYDRWMGGLQFADEQCINDVL